MELVGCTIDFLRERLEAQFEELLAFVEETRFDHCTGFIYSPEEGTDAFGLDGEVPRPVREERFARLTQLQERISAEINADLIGTRERVLVDEPAEAGCCGRTERDAPEIDGQVLITDGEAPVGSFVEVEITGAYAYELRARAVGEPH